MMMYITMMLILMSDFNAPDAVVVIHFAAPQARGGYSL